MGGETMESEYFERNSFSEDILENQNIQNLRYWKKELNFCLEDASNAHDLSVCKAKVTELENRYSKSSFQPSSAENISLNERAKEAKSKMEDTENRICQLERLLGLHKKKMQQADRIINENDQLEIDNIASKLGSASQAQNEP